MIGLVAHRELVRDDAPAARLPVALDVERELPLSEAGKRVAGQSRISARPHHARRGRSSPGG